MEFRLEAAENTAYPRQALEVYAGLHSSLLPVRDRLDQSKIDALLCTLGNSNFLARWARRHPEKVAEVLSGDLAHAKLQDDFFREFRVALDRRPDWDAEGLAESLLDLKYRHLFRITLRDLGFRRPLREIVAEFSSLARAVLHSSLDWHLNRCRSDFGMPVSAPDFQEEIPFCILAMGKLGGDELNFSSDIDLIYFYGTDEGRVDGASGLNPHEYFGKLAERLGAFLRKKNPDGFLYRVDLELRPEGKAGTLVNSLDAMEGYYESFGADWEKQAMIRASLGAGDASLAEEFLRRIHPFVFPKVGDFGFLKRLKHMKGRILEAVRKQGRDGFHVKLGEGGIREVEFFVQALQMLFGGQNAALQIPNTLEVLPRLREAGLIETREEETLAKAYVFLRTLEHRLQLAEEEQTHQLPESSEELENLARRMAYFQPDRSAAAAAMLADLALHRRAVQEIFDDMMAKRFEAEG